MLARLKGKNAEVIAVWLVWDSSALLSEVAMLHYSGTRIDAGAESVILKMTGNHAINILSYGYPRQRAGRNHPGVGLVPLGTPAGL